MSNVSELLPSGRGVERCDGLPPQSQDGEQVCVYVTCNYAHSRGPVLFRGISAACSTMQIELYARRH